jgi:hypothetical protein
MAVRVDKTISKISGIKNYMDQLAVITGNIHSITPEFYMDQLSKLDSINRVICSSIMELKSKELTKLFERIKSSYEALDILHPYVEKMHKKSNRVSKKCRLRPEDIYNSKWFECMKEISARCLELSKQFEIETGAMTSKQQKIIEENPHTVETFKFYDVPMVTNEAYKCVYVCRKFIDRIIEILLTPMYDMKGYIEKHWNTQIDSVIGTKLKDKIKTNDGTIHTEDIQRYIYIFVLSKYRLEITGSPDQFAKILMHSISEYDIAELNATKFIHLIDNIDFNQVEDNKNIKALATIAKEEIIKLSSAKEVSIKEIMEDIDKFLSVEEEEEQPKPEIKEAEKIVEEQDELFD